MFGDKIKRLVEKLNFLAKHGVTSSRLSLDGLFNEDVRKESVSVKNIHPLTVVEDYLSPGQ
jgi:hypothetical protein